MQKLPHALAACLAAHLVACADPLPCDEVPGTCLNVYLGSQKGERVDTINFSIEGDGDFRHTAAFNALRGGQLLPLVAPLPLPDAAQRTIKVSATALWNSEAILTGSRVVADLSPGQHRSISLVLMGKGEGACANNVKDGDETGVDCGGSCAACPPSCTDKAKNGDESDADCGGSCDLCLGEQTCRGDADCVSAHCDAGRCRKALGVAAITPASGPTGGGAMISLRGELFTADMKVLFGATAVTPLRVEPDGKTATVVQPRGAAGRVDLAVQAGGDEWRRPMGFGYYYGTLRFGQTPTLTYKTGQKPYFLVSGDLNGDSKADLVVINEQGGSLSVYLGNGDGTFAPLPEFPATDSFPVQLRLGDANRDGKLDVYTANHRFPSISIYLGKGDGTFEKGVEYPLPFRTAMKPWPNALTVGDWNKDGYDDVAATEFENMGSLYVLLADKKGGLSAPVPQMGIPLNNNDPEPAVGSGHFNGDDALDLAVTIRGNQVARIFLNDGAGGFKQGADFPIGGVGPFIIETADMDGDKKTDLVIACRGNALLSVLSGVGDGTFRRARTVMAGDTPFAVGIGDLDGDGLLDVGVPNWMGEFMGMSLSTLLFGDGRGGFPRSFQVAVPQKPYGLTLDDFDKDGKLDFATVSPTITDTLGVFVNRSE